MNEDNDKQCLDILSEIQTRMRAADYEISVSYLDSGKSRFLIEPVIEDLTENDWGRFSGEMLANYVEGVTLYEKYPAEFSQLFPDAHAHGILRAREYVCAECVKRFLDEMTICVRSLDEVTEYVALGTSDKYSRQQEINNRTRRIEQQKTAEFYQGFDQGKKAAREEARLNVMKTEPDGFRDFLRKLFGTK